MRFATKVYVLHFTFFLLLTFLTSACSSPPPPPTRLYLFDVSSLHLNHYQHCLDLTGEPDQCDAATPPPAGKTYTDLLRDYDTLIFLTTLQGIVNRDRPQLYLLHDTPWVGQEAGSKEQEILTYPHPSTLPTGVDAFWLAKYQEAGQPYGWLAGTELVELENLADILATFADQVNGVVLWDPALPATLNVATTMAGVEDLAVLRAGSELEPEVTRWLEIKQTLVGLFKAGAITLPDSDTPSTGSPKNDAYLWASENYLATGRANAQFLAYLLDGWPATRYAHGQLTRGGVYALERDYVVQQRGFVFDLAPWADEPPLDDPNQPLGTDLTTFTTLLTTAQAQAGGLIKVWGFIPWYEKYSSHVGGLHPATAGEWESTWLFSQHGAYLQGGAGDVYGAAMANVSVHKFGPPPATRAYPAPPNEADLIERGYLTSEGQVAPDRTFVLFYAGDYDLAHPVQVLLGDYANRPWLDPRRGDVPLAWGFNPALVEDIPGVITYLYATQSEQDYFVGANTGAGYLNPDGPSEWLLLQWLARTRSYYTDYGYNVQGFLLNGNGAHLSQRRLDAWTWLAPVGILSPDIQTDEPWPRLQWDTPLSALPAETLFGSPEIATAAVHHVYQRLVLTEGRLPFLAFRAAFQSPSLLAETRDQLATGAFTDLTGQPITPNYTIVDPYTYFYLLKLALVSEGN